MQWTAFQEAAPWAGGGTRYRVTNKEQRRDKRNYLIGWGHESTLFGERKCRVGLAFGDCLAIPRFWSSRVCTGTRVTAKFWLAGMQPGQEQLRLRLRSDFYNGKGLPIAAPHPSRRHALITPGAGLAWRTGCEGPVEPCLCEWRRTIPACLSEHGEKVCEIIGIYLLSL